ncbi:MULTISPECIES: L-histidine N(alpha)-methyltransferase [unclassified Mucilaginibacter]|uniref:L-histidine N(alpha)-methyltransferase n=1 Tax=unclassified Mucilaginibacter TaxID=2617802 RepID=UPI002AC96B03|nr:MULTISPECIES: L-histidine N(alpha)-methyltransferase [unclassified Mucilaginibacter]MEB0263469.1 L-histidine N(alpha)-methyltransferase [Mucilaginibacter sp. 10I4]MEB0279641.1 L-histidine N(alpha)-methyltransferase [Mucilaginibacter sp. 10B2]MEB0302382.1 L-histidine N(alpha)-methyltransferase [Mucilaginibacter sp. 5C4]WPX23799.1 L-histidine N(alpha)-methyltransferase [Mucilaginibacter sp. 5C4]
MEYTNTAIQQTTANTPTDDRFLQDVVAGLTSTPKHLESKYFYDAPGDKIFQELMNCEEYYPTNCEMEIFTSQTAEICKAIIADGDAFDLIELGAGDATKSTQLLKYLIDNEADFTYLPIDISDNVISYLNITLPVTLPGIKIEGLNGEYFDMLKKAAAISDKRKVVMFLGSNIGNMQVADAEAFCKELRNNLSAGDMVLIGVDLKKNPATVLAAYNDSEGITKRFNINLLERINRELGGDFNTRQFDHYAMYDPETGSCKSYLISLADQNVKIGQETISFQKDEYIYMEISQKYAVEQVNEMAGKSGFKPFDQFFDSKKWFVDAVWIAD